MSFYKFDNFSQIFYRKVLNSLKMKIISEFIKVESLWHQGASRLEGSINEKESKMILRKESLRLMI